MTSQHSDRTIVTARVIKHPRAAVWNAFANAKRLANWWGPTGFTSVIKTFDFRPGGSWSLTMTGPDGTKYENAMTFDEVRAPERIVYMYVDPVHEFRMEITLEEQGANTLLAWRMTFAHQEEFDRVKPFVVPANEQNFDKLEHHLRTL